MTVDIQTRQPKQFGAVFEYITVYFSQEQMAQITFEEITHLQRWQNILTVDTAWIYSHLTRTLALVLFVFPH